MRRKGFLILALSIIVVVGLGSAARHLLLQKPLFDGTQILFEQTYNLAGVVSDDLVVFAEHISLPADSRAAGDIALLADTVVVDGPVSGDLTVLADTVRIGPGAQINGNATLMADQVMVDGQIDGTLHVRSGTLQIQDAAQVGEMVYVCADSFTDTRAEPASRSCEDSDLWSSTRTLESLHDPNVILPLLNITISGAAVGVMFTALASLALSGLSILAVVLFPRQISHIEEAVRTGSRTLGGTGLMMIVLAAGVSFALALVVVSIPVLGLVVVPVYLLGALLFFGMTLAGWITMTLVAGDLLLRRVSRAALPPLVIAAIGNVSLLLAWNVLALHPITRVLAVMGLFVLGVVGLGAAFVTRMGTKPVHRSYFVQG